MAKIGQKQKQISEVLILQIVKEKKNGKSYSYLARKYKVSDGSIATWVRRYTYKGYVTREKRGVKKSTSKMTIEELRTEVDILKKFQAFLKQQHVEK